MKTQIVKKPTQDVLSSLKFLSNGRCLWPGCDNVGNTIVALLKNNRETPCFENSILLCEDHASSCSRNPDTSSATLVNLRELMRSGRGLPATDKCQSLHSRSAYLEMVSCEVPKSKTVRCIYVGPLPFHPEWYFDLREGQTKMTSMDRAIAAALRDKNTAVTLIIRNDHRYIEKVKSDVDQSLLPLLVKKTKENFEELVLSNKYNNTVIFWDIGPYHIPIVLDTACIFAIRNHPRSPIECGSLIRDAERVAKEKEMFDELVSIHRDNNASLDELDKFMAMLY